MDEGLEIDAPVSNETSKAIAFAIRVVSFGLSAGFLIHAVRWW